MIINIAVFFFADAKHYRYSIFISRFLFILGINDKCNAKIDFIVIFLILIITTQLYWYNIFSFFIFSIHETWCTIRGTTLYINSIRDKINLKSESDIADRNKNSRGLTSRAGKNYAFYSRTPTFWHFISFDICAPKIFLGLCDKYANCTTAWSRRSSGTYACRISTLRAGLMRIKTLGNEGS